MRFCDLDQLPEGGAVVERRMEAVTSAVNACQFQHDFSQSEGDGDLVADMCWLRGGARRC